MRKQRKTKQAVLALAGFVVLVAAAAAVTQFIEAKSRREIVETRAAYEAEKTVQTLRLYGQDYAYDHKFETYLFLGTDGSGNEEGEGEAYIGSMADFIGLLILDTTEETYALLQLNRDTMAEVFTMDADGSWDSDIYIKEQLCMAHWYGGSKEMSCENTVNTVSSLLGGLPLDGYYALSMDYIPELNHAVGGVTLTVEEDLSDVDPALVKGATVTLTDEQVELYVRRRYGVGDGENLGRMERQKQFLKAFMNELGQKGSQNSNFALKVFHELEELAVSDINGKTISKLAKKLPSYTEKGIFTFEGIAETAVSNSDQKIHMEFTPDQDSVVEIMTELFSLEPYEGQEKEEAPAEEELDLEWEKEMGRL